MLSGIFYTLNELLKSSTVHIAYFLIFIEYFAIWLNFIIGPTLVFGEIQWAISLPILKLTSIRNTTSTPTGKIFVACFSWFLSVYLGNIYESLKFLRILVPRCFCAFVKKAKTYYLVCLFDWMGIVKF